MKKNVPFSSLSDDNEKTIMKKSNDNNLSIEYCTGCWWMLWLAWVTQELVTTFWEDINSITIIPNRCEKCGVFLICHYFGDDLTHWVQDLVVSENDLGHSEKKDQSISTTI